MCAPYQLEFRFSPHPSFLQLSVHVLPMESVGLNKIDSHALGKHELRGCLVGMEIRFQNLFLEP